MMTPTRPSSAPAALIMVLLATFPLRAGEYVKAQSPVEMRLGLANPKIAKADDYFKVEDNGLVESRLSNVLLLTLRVEGKAPLTMSGGDDGALSRQVKALKDSGLWYPDDCKPAGPAKHTDIGDGKERWEAQILLSAIPPKEGPIELQPVPLEYTEGPDDAPKKAEWPAVKLRITTDVASLDPRKELRDITPPENPPPPPPSWTRWLPWAGIAAALAGLVAGGWGLRRYFAAPPPPPAAHEWAAQELGRIEALRLPEAGEAERYHTLLSDVVRAYLERRFSLPASQQTTAEFLETMRRSPQLTPPQQGLLREFLERCDMAKFARAAPPPEECRAVAAMARSFVQETTPRPK
jgi:hypothetical protein